MRASPSSMRGDHARVDHGRGDEDLGAGGREDRGERSASARASSAGDLVEDERHEGAHEAQSMAVQERAQRDGSSGR